eukprot:scaffold4543_cov126-Isochrysis_galbana.AAC.17
MVEVSGTGAGGGEAGVSATMEMPRDRMIGANGAVKLSGEWTMDSIEGLAMRLCAREVSWNRGFFNARTRNFPKVELYNNIKSSAHPSPSLTLSPPRQDPPSPTSQTLPSTTSTPTALPSPTPPRRRPHPRLSTRAAS